MNAVVNPEAFKTNLYRLNHTAWLAIDAIQSYEQMKGDADALQQANKGNADAGQEEDGPDEYLEYTKSELRATIESMAALVRFVLEHYGTESLSKTLEQRLSAIKDWADSPPQLHTDTPHTPAIEVIWQHADALLNSLDFKYGDDFRLNHLAEMLENTGHIVEVEDLEPAKEGDVKKLMFKYLKFYYPTATDEAPVPSAVTTYRADTGITDLKAAVEYKYAVDAKEVKTSIEGINADTVHYAASPLWKHFFAVLYMTGQYVSPAQLKDWASKLPDNWKVIFVVGKGDRKPKQKNADRVVAPQPEKT